MNKEQLLKETLDEYKHLIDAKKPNKLSISTYRVEKPWGYELWLELNENYAYKLNHFNAGNKGSLQSHEYKYETCYVIEGEAEVLIENDEGVLESYIFSQGMGWSVPLKRKHRVIAHKDFTVLEVQTPYLNDIIRYQDDTNRMSGKIKEEHV